MAYGLGVVGLSFGDWSGLTPDEFGAVCKAYNDAERERAEGAWERMRLLAAIGIQPHVKKRIRPHELLPLPWDRKAAHEAVGKAEGKARLLKTLGKLR